MAAAECGLSSMSAVNRCGATALPNPARRTGINIAAVYCIFAGLSEVWVGITGNWLGLLSKPLKPSFRTAVVGACYVAAGMSLLLRNRTGRLLGIAFVLLELLGRVHLVRTGIYPSRGPDFVKSVIGGAIAVLTVVYLACQSRQSDSTQKA